MSLKIFSKGPNGPSSREVKKLQDVASVAGRLHVEGHRDIRIGTSKKTALPFEQWKIHAQGVSVESV
jgi:hypothetical protein